MILKPLRHFLQNIVCKTIDKITKMNRINLNSFYLSIYVSEKVQAFENEFCKNVILVRE